MSDSFYLGFWGTIGILVALGLIFTILMMGNLLQAFLRAVPVVLMRRLRKK